MGAPDIALRKYFGDKERLADIFNYYCFSGREEILAEDIETKNPIENSLISKNKKNYPVERIRDVLAVAQKGETTLILLGIENQMLIHYGMPVRNMLYNALTYANQMESRAKRNKKRLQKQRDKIETGDRISQEEFLSGLKKGEKLTPVVSLVLYYGDKPWDGPKNLADMLDMDRIPKEFQPYIQSHYPINLLEIRKIPDYGKFRSDVKEVFQMVSCANDKDKMKQMIEQNEKYHHLPHDAVDAIAVLTASKELMNYADKSKKGESDMCKAIQDMIREGEENGEKRGRQQGLEQGIQIFILDNMEENVPSERIRQKLQRRFELTAEAANQYIMNVTSQGSIL